MQEHEQPAGYRATPGIKRPAEISDDIYVRFRDMLRDRCGLHYPDRKRADLAFGLSQAMNAGGYQDLEAFCVEAAAEGPAWDTLLAHLTVGETYFFRNAPQFAALRHHILPELIQRRSTIRTLRIWSAGCATGEEPYSAAMLLSDMLPKEEPWQVSILATDINPHFLARARTALYGNWSFREMPDGVRDHYFREEHGRWRLDAEIRRMVFFMRLNLAEPCYPAITNGTCVMDVIFCRNVMIYFDEETTQQVITRLYHALSPGGWLLVGHAEPQMNFYQQFEVHNFPNAVIYRKPLDAPPFSLNLADSALNAS